jgi:hypothetical protein
MAADEAGAAGDKELHSLMFSRRGQDAKEFFTAEAQRRGGVFVNVNVSVKAW